MPFPKTQANLPAFSSHYLFRAERQARKPKIIFKTTEVNERERSETHCSCRKSSKNLADEIETVITKKGLEESAKWLKKQRKTKQILQVYHALVEKMGI